MDNQRSEFCLSFLSEDLPYVYSSRILVAFFQTRDEFIPHKQEGRNREVMQQHSGAF